MNKKKSGKSRSPQSWWYYLERYVHVAVNSGSLLLYNTLNGKYLEYKNRPDLVRFVKRLQSPGQLQVIKLTRPFLEKSPGIERFIKLTRRYYMADLIDTAYSSRKPVQAMPILNIHRDVKKLKADPARSVGDNLLKNLDQVSLYLNSSVNPCMENRHSQLFAGGYRQFLCNCHSSSGIPNLEFGLIKRFLTEISGAGLSFVNILGGDIFRYPEFHRLLELLAPVRAIKRFYTLYSDVLSNLEYLKQIDALRMPYQMVVLVPFPVEMKELRTSVVALQNAGIPFCCEFIVQSESHLESAARIEEKEGILHVSFHPFYNGRNLGFLKKHMFMKKTDIMTSGPEMCDIFMRTAVNPANFGKLTVLTNGDVYANVNTPRLGRLGKDSVYRMVYREMDRGTGWRWTRLKAKPCKKCLYKLLCPPILNYEYVLKRNNLCHLVP